MGLAVVLPLLRFLSCSSQLLELSAPQKPIIVQSRAEDPCTRSFSFFLPISCWISILSPLKLLKKSFPCYSFPVSDQSKPCRSVLTLILVCLHQDLKFWLLFRPDSAVFNFTLYLTLWVSWRSIDENFQLCIFPSWGQGTNSCPLKHWDNLSKTNSAPCTLTPSWGQPWLEGQ